MKKIHFIAGLPRSGSTLLANLLMQNPAFHVSPTSGMVDMLSAVRQAWDANPALVANPDDDGKLTAMRGLLDGYYGRFGKEVCFDRGRPWLHWIEFLEAAYGEVKIICCVRDLRDVVASWEKLWRKNYLRHDNMTDQDRKFCATIDGRIDYWLRKDQETGAAYSWIHDAFHRGHGDKLFLLDYDDLTADPAKAMHELYTYLEQPIFLHNFKNVKQTIFENDHVYGLGDLHTIRTKIEPQESRWYELLGDAGANLAQLNFWKNNAQERHRSGQN